MQINPSRDVTAVVLSAGRGTRLAPLTNTMQKQMISFFGKPALFYVIENIKAAGITNVVIVAAGAKTGAIKRFFGDGKRFGIRIRYRVQEEMLGPANAIRAAESAVKSRYMLVQYGDSISDGNIAAALIERLKKGPDTSGVLAIREVDDPTRYGIVQFDGSGRIVGVVEKPHTDPPSKMATIGTFILQSKPYFSAVRRLDFHSAEEFPADYLLRRGERFGAYVYRGDRVDIGKPPDLFNAAALLQKRIARQGGSARISAVILDSDNTIFKTRGIARDCDLAAMEVLSRACDVSPEDLYEELTQVVPRTVESKNPRMRSRVHSYGLLSKRHGVECQSEMYEAFLSDIQRKILVDKRAAKALKKLRGKRLFLATEDDRTGVLAKLKATGITSLFERVITSTETGVMKPSARYYRMAIAGTGLCPSECIAVGDNFEKDIVPAVRIGMQGLLVEKPGDLLKLLRLK